MAKKQAAKKTQTSKKRKGMTPHIVVAVFFFTLGLWLGSGGVRFNDGKFSLVKPDWNKFTAAVTKVKPQENNPATGAKPSLAFWESEYGDCDISRIVSVYDGDTFRCDIDSMPNIIGKNIGIRIRGIDTPEMNDKNQYIKARAIDAREFAKRKLMAAQKVKLKNIDRDKYFRILADVYVDGENLGELLLKSALANQYDGGTKENWE